MPGFDPAAFEEVTVLPPERVRHHLVRFDEGLTEAVQNGFRCGELRADNLVAQAQLLGFAHLAEALSAAFSMDHAGPDTARGSAETAVAKARPKIAELIRTVKAT